MRIAVLVKQIPKFEEMELGPDGRLRRDGIELEMNPYCRRAVSQGRRARGRARRGSHVTVFTLGPPAADDTLREAIAWGLDRDVDIDGVLVTDAAFAGSDTLATAKALAAALDHAKARSISCSPAATRSTPTPARSGRSSPSSSTSRSSPACATSRSTATLVDAALRARRRLDAGRGRAARGAVVRGAAVRSGEGRPAGPGRGARRPHPRADRRRPRPRTVGRRTRHPRGSAR